VIGRLTAPAGGGNSLTIAGRAFAGGEIFAAEMLGAGYLSGERDLSATELLRDSAFTLTPAGGRGLNLWGGGEYVAAEGNHNGIDYDGNTTAFHLGIDTAWQDGLIGIALGRSAGDTDFTVKADGMKSTLETTVTSVHPYLTRRLNDVQLWLTAGHGSGDAEVKEPDVTITTDLTVTTAAFGITHARDERLSAGVSALYARARLDAATAGGRALPNTSTNALRIKAHAEAGWTRDNLRPFLTLALRHDSGDGDTGGAADLGGGAEWQTPAARIRLEGSAHLAGNGAEEQRLNLTARKTAGRLNLGLTIGMENGLNTANLLSGEWRF